MSTARNGPAVLSTAHPPLTEHLKLSQLCTIETPQLTIPLLLIYQFFQLGNLQLCMPAALLLREGLP